MRKLRSMIGMPVVCRNRRVGRMIRAELTDDLRALKGIWVGAGIRGTRFIPAEALQLLGRVAILSDVEGARGRMKTPPLFRRAVGTDGSRLGAITGAEIDEVTFAVTALELSRGLWDDLARGRQSVTRYTADPETGGIVVDPAGEAKEGEAYEGRLDQGTDRRDGDRIGGSGDVRGRQLADGAQPEPEGEVGGQLDRQQG